MITRAHHATIDDESLNVHAMEHALGVAIVARRLFATQHTEDCIVRNVKLNVKGNVLTITIDLSATRESSKSGKSDIIASTEGNVLVPGTKAADQIKLGLNLYASK